MTTEATRDVGINDVVAFFVEVGALVLLGVWAWLVAPDPVPVRLLAVVVVLGAAAVLWSLFAAPRAAFDLPVLAVAVKILVLGGSVMAAYTMLPGWLVVCWAVLVGVNTAAVTVMRLT